MLEALERICQELRNRLKNHRKPSRSEAIISIELAIDSTGVRTGSGRLEIQTQPRKRLLGPVAIQTYGNIPMIHYDVMGIRVSGPGTCYPAQTYGPEGIVLLEGDHLSQKNLSEKIYLTIQGGNRSREVDLLATTAGIQVSNGTMHAIVIALETIEGAIGCRLTEYPGEQHREQYPTSEFEEHESGTESESTSFFESQEELLENERDMDYDSSEERLGTNWMNDDGYA
jgi:hypothetical protein